MSMDTVVGGLSNLRLTEKSAISLEETEPDYILHLDMQKCALDSGSTYLAASSSNYRIRIYSKENLASCGSIQGHEDVITGVRFSPTDRNILYSSSLDKTVRSWDLRTFSKTPVQIFHGADSAKLPLSSFDISCNDMAVCAGTEAAKEDVYLLFWDRRKANLLGCYSECHMNDITQVIFHPTNSDRLATGSTDGLVSILDISQSCEDDALEYTLNSESSVSQLGWCSNDYSHIYCLTHIETFHIWDSVEGDQLISRTDIRDQYKECKTRVDYLVDCLEIDGQLYLISGDTNGQVHLMPVDDDGQLEVACTLSGGHKDVVRCAYWDGQKHNLITGGEDSMICLWSPEQGSLELKLKDKKMKAKTKKTAPKKAKPY